jgi:hypothetical protein
MTGAIDVFNATAYAAAATGADVWSQAPYSLSVPRESTTVTAISRSLLVSGGWKWSHGKGIGDNTVDLFEGVEAVAEQRPRGPSPGAAAAAAYKLSVDGFCVGAAQVGSHAYVVGNQRLYYLGDCLLAGVVN